MTVTNPSQCPRCGTLRPAQVVALGLCPACLLATALSIDDEPCPYQVLAPISEDPHSTTYLAQALSGTRGYVALRVHGARDDADRVLTRYRRWKTALACVQHPNIARLLDIGLTAEGLLYVASEYVGGWPLTALGSRTSLGPDERAEIARQLTAALDAAHAAGVMHLKLDASKVKITTINGPHATILGFGSSLIVDGTAGEPDVDRLALARIINELGIEL